MKESTIEKSISKEAFRRGWLNYKFKTANHRGVPDRIFMRNGVMFFVEFKSEGGKVTELQKYQHERITTHGFNVHIIDNIESGYAMLDSYDFEEIERE
ncbi:MAG: VRR-NUC domain-containing protein [Sphaerospermopsis sp.]|nr:VRR-NUC domain-containing protein [Sphaerospermopsis sp.]